MLIIRTYLAASSIHGLGVFANENVAPGRIISRFMPPLDVTLPPEYIPILSPAEQEYLKIYAYHSIFSQLYVLTGDHDRFMNHSDDPNVGMNPDGTSTNIALREIAAGEELTCDYRTFDADWKTKLGVA